MSAVRLAAHSTPSYAAFVDASSPALQAVERAWQRQYSDLGAALRTAAQAVTFAESCEDRSALGYALFQSAYAAIRLGAPRHATAAADRCRGVFEALADTRGAWLASVAQALCIRFQGEGERSIRLLHDLEARPSTAATGTDRFIVHVALSLGYRFVGLLEPALKWHYQALDTARVTGDTLLLASTLCNLGGYHADLHNPEEGCRLLEEGLALAAARDGDRTAVITALNLSQAYAALGRHADALALAERYLTDERYRLSIGREEPTLPLTLALAYANSGRADDARTVFETVRDHLVRQKHEEGTPYVFWTYVEARIALVAGEPARAAQVALKTLAQVDDLTVDSPADLMQLHATAASACEQLGDYQRALGHERSRAAIRERLARLAAHVTSLTRTIRHELDTTRAERDRILALHAELEREHDKLASLNEVLTAQIAENLRLHDELKEQNFRDALTGLHNRRYLYERGPRLLDAGPGSGAPLCLVMLDLDHFKRLNDVHGHVVGDRVLVALGRLLRDSLRENDMVCRVGGEEFAMLLPTSNAQVARERLQGMLDDCRRMTGPLHEEALPADLTFSAGIAEAPEHGTTIDALMIAADRSLYRAKNNGRARIEVAAAVFDAGPPSPAAARETVDH